MYWSAYNGGLSWEGGMVVEWERWRGGRGGSRVGGGGGDWDGGQKDGAAGWGQQSRAGGGERVIDMSNVLLKSLIANAMWHNILYGSL